MFSLRSDWYLPLSKFGKFKHFDNSHLLARTTKNISLVSPMRSDDVFTPNILVSYHIV